MSSSRRTLPGPIERSPPKSTRRCSDVFPAGVAECLALPRPIAGLCDWTGRDASRDRSGGLVAEHRLDLQELFQAPLAVLAAVARLLVAAERRGGVAGRIVQVHVAGAHLRRELAGPLD